MSSYLTMELEREGPAKRVAGERGSGDLFFANHLPYCFDPVHAAAQRLGIASIFEFAKGLDETRVQAEIAVYGKPMEEIDGSEAVLPSEETEAAVSRIYYSTGPWFDPAEGLRTGNAMIAHFRGNPSELADCPNGDGVVRDLEALVNALQEAQRRGRRFRINYSS